MPLALAPDISFCTIDGTRIFLDRRRDRYFSLAPEADAAFAALEEQRAGAHHAARLAVLADGGVLVDDPCGEAPRPCPSVTIRSSPLDEDPHLPAPFLAALSSAAAIRAARRDLRARGFAHICQSVERLAAPARQARPMGANDLSATAGRIARATRIAGAFEQCLPLAVATIRFCRRRGFAAQFVIGVKLHPFQAHAWVSAGGSVLTDQSATVRQFTPILVL